MKTALTGYYVFQSWPCRPWHRWAARRPYEMRRVYRNACRLVKGWPRATRKACIFLRLTYPREAR